MAKINSKKSKITKLYSDSWEYIKSCKFSIYWIVSLFFAFAILGFFVPMSQETLDILMGYIKDLLEQTQGMSVLELISFIFLNNLQASFMGLILGLLLGIVPVFLTILNGYILGFVASIAVGKEGFFSLLNLFPHGIFELPAVFISLALGLKLGTFIFQKNRTEFLKENMFKSLQVFFLIIIPLLAIAAIIEGSLIILMR